MRAGVESLAGVLQFRDYGSYIEDLKRGDTSSSPTPSSDPRTAATAAALKALSAPAFVNMPVTEQGGFVALLYLNHAEPRDWRPESSRFIREVAERTRTAVERRRAERSGARERGAAAFPRCARQGRPRRAPTPTPSWPTTTRMLGRASRRCRSAPMPTWTPDRGRLHHPRRLERARLAQHRRPLQPRRFRQAGGREPRAPGKPLVVNDNLAELAPEEAATFQSIGIAATICMPLVKEGRLTALMAIHDKRAARCGPPMNWRCSREVTERSWAHIERVRAEAELRASEAQFRLLAQAMPNHVWTARPDGQLDWFNEQVYAYSGTRPGELEGERMGRDRPPRRCAVSRQAMGGVAGDGQHYETEFRLRRYDGVCRWHLARAVPLRDVGGTIVRWIGTNTDVDDRKNAESVLAERLEERTAERDRIWRVSQDMLGVADAYGVWQSVNPAWTRILGWTEREVVGRTSDWLRHPEDLEIARAETAGLRGRQSARVRHPLSRQGGEIPDTALVGNPGRRCALLRRARHHRAAGKGDRAGRRRRSAAAGTENGGSRQSDRRPRP